MASIITIQYPYTHLTVTLNHNKTMIDQIVIEKYKAVSGLIPAIQQLLSSHNLKLQDLTYLGINIGPGPFNTLRSIIATANGIAFATNIPLVQVNGLELLLQESMHKYTVALLDACGNDIYFGIAHTQTFGSCCIQQLITQLQQLGKHPWHFIGNGAYKYEQQLQAAFTSKDITIDTNILFASNQSLVNATYSRYLKGQIERELFPLYFQTQVMSN